MGFSVNIFLHQKKIHAMHYKTKDPTGHNKQVLMFFVKRSVSQVIDINK